MFLFGTTHSPDCIIPSPLPIGGEDVLGDDLGVLPLGDLPAFMEEESASEECLLSSAVGDGGIVSTHIMG